MRWVGKMDFRAVLLSEETVTKSISLIIVNWVGIRKLGFAVCLDMLLVVLLVSINETATLFVDFDLLDLMSFIGFTISSMNLTSFHFTHSVISSIYKVIFRMALSEILQNLTNLKANLIQIVFMGHSLIKKPESHLN